MPPPVQPVQDPGGPSRVEEFLTRQLEVLSDIRYALTHPQPGGPSAARPAAPPGVGLPAGPAPPGAAPAAQAVQAQAAQMTQAAQAQAQAARALAALQAQAQQQQARAAFGATPLGQVQARAAAAGQQQAAAAQAGLQAQQAQAQAAQGATPQGQVQAQAQAAAQQQQTLAQMRLRAQQLQAQAAALETPAGRQAHREQLAAQAQQQAAQERIARAQNIAQHGQVGGALLNFRQSLVAATPVVAAAAAAFYMAFNAAAKASPQAAATFSGSLDLLQARVGKVFIPVVEAVSRGLQNLTGNVAAAAPTEEERTLPGRMRQQYEATREGRPIPLEGGRAKLQSLEGLGQTGMFASPEQYRDRLTMASLQYDDLQVALLEEQLSNLKENTVLLTELVDNSRGLQNLTPSFR